jgi:hypothetical protein
MVMTSTEETGMPMGEVLLSHISAMLTEDLMSNSVEVIWLQVHLPHLTLFL